MQDDIKPKIRALIEDFTKSNFETFQYKTSNIWTLSESNIVEVTKVLKNGLELGSGEYDYDSVTNKITITASLNTDDIIEVDYIYYKYSDNELYEYIRGALVWISTFAFHATDYELENENIYPTPDNRTLDLIALISAILIKPDYTNYRLGNLTVVYEQRMPKDQKIQKIISRFKMGLGVNGIIEID